MSAAETEDLDVPEEPNSAEETDEEDQPEIGDDEMADWGSVGEDLDEGADDQEESDDESKEQTTEDQGAPDLGGGQTSLGDVYCNALGMGAAVTRDRYGELEGDRAEVMDEYADMARQLDIDDYVDDWLAQHGGVDQLSPGQGVMLMTVVFGCMVAVEDPSLAGNIMEAADGE